MCLISSIALTADEDVLALSFYANETHFAIQLEDGVLSVLETDGKLLYTLQHKIWSKVAIADGKIIVAEDEEECVSIYNVGTGKVLSTLTLPTAVEKLIPNPSDPSSLIAVSSLHQITLLSLTPPPSSSAAAPYAVAAQILPYNAFKYHAAHSLLALLCSDGIIHIWNLPESTSSSNAGLQSLCIIYPFSSLPPFYNSDIERGEEEKAKQMYSVLILSTTQVLTGHRDGKIRVWDISFPPTSPLFDQNAAGDESTKPSAINTPLCVIQAHQEVRGLVNGLLSLPTPVHTSSDENQKFISTGTDGFAKVWSLSSTSNTLVLLSEIKLFDHAIVARTLSNDGKWLFAGGKEGGGEEDVCGLDGRVKAWNLKRGDAGEVKQLGYPAQVVWNLQCVKGDRLIVSLMKKGRAHAEVWNVENMDTFS